MNDLNARSTSRKEPLSVSRVFKLTTEHTPIAHAHTYEDVIVLVVLESVMQWHHAGVPSGVASACVGRVGQTLMMMMLEPRPSHGTLELRWDCWAGP